MIVLGASVSFQAFVTSIQWYASKYLSFRTNFSIVNLTCNRDFSRPTTFK